MWRVTTAFDDDANPSNDGPRSPLNRLHSCCAGGILRYDVRLWLRGPTAIEMSQARRWTDKNPPSRPAGCLGRGSVARLPAPGRASTCCPEPPAYSARPGHRAGDETNTDAPSRHPQRSTHAGAACHWPATCPTPTDAASDTLCGRWARRLCPGAPCQWSILWADTGACRPGYGPAPTRSPNRRRLDSCRPSPAGHTTGALRLPTRARTWESSRDRTPGRHRRVPI